MKKLLICIIYFFIFAPVFAEAKEELQDYGIETGLYYDKIGFENYKYYQNEQVFLLLTINQVIVPNDLTKDKIIPFLYESIKVNFGSEYNLSDANNLFKIVPVNSETLKLDITELEKNYDNKDFIIVLKPYIKQGDNFISAGKDSIYYYFLSENGKYLYFSEHSNKYEQQKGDLLFIEENKNFEKLRKRLLSKLQKLSTEKRGVLKEKLLSRINTLINKNTLNFRSFLNKNIHTEGDVERNKIQIDKYKKLLSNLSDFRIMFSSIDIESGEVRVTTGDNFLNIIDKSINKYINILNQAE